MRKGLWQNLLGRELHPSHRTAAFEIERKLAHRKLDAGSVPLLPQTSEASLLEPLVIQAQPRPVIQQHLAPCTRLAGKQVAVARERIAAELRDHQAVERVKSFA